MSDHDEPLDPAVGASAGPDGHEHVQRSHADERRYEDLVLLALGEPAQEWLDAHDETCPDCQQQLHTYREVVGLARSAGPAQSLSDDEPPATVWAAIAAELDLDKTHGAPSASTPTSESTSESTPTSTSTSTDADSKTVVDPAAFPLSGPDVSSAPTPLRSAHPRNGVRAARTGRWLVVAAAVILAAAVAAIAGFSAGRSDRRAPSVAAVTVLSQAQLSQQPGGPVNVSGAAKVHTSANGLAITVDTHGLPLRRGYYQVWLYDPLGKHMVPVGALDDSGHGTFSVPAAVDLRTYDVLDISAQDYGEDYVHKQTVLQGPLTA